MRSDASFPSSLTSSPSLPSSSLQLGKRHGGFWRWGAKATLDDIYESRLHQIRTQLCPYWFCFFVQYARTKVEGLGFLEGGGRGVAWIQLTCTSLRSEHGSSLSWSYPLLGEASRTAIFTTSKVDIPLQTLQCK